MYYVLLSPGGAFRDAISSHRDLDAAIADAHLAAEQLARPQDTVTYRSRFQQIYHRSPAAIVRSPSGTIMACTWVRS